MHSITMHCSGINLSLYHTLELNVSSPELTHWRRDVSWMLTFIASSIWKSNKLSYYSAHCSCTLTLLSADRQKSPDMYTLHAHAQVYVDLLCVRGAYVFFCKASDFHSISVTVIPIDMPFKLEDGDWISRAYKSIVSSQILWIFKWYAVYCSTK